MKKRIFESYRNVCYRSWIVLLTLLICFQFESFAQDTENKAVSEQNATSQNNVDAVENSTSETQTEEETVQDPSAETDSEKEKPAETSAADSLLASQKGNAQLDSETSKALSNVLKSNYMPIDILVDGKYVSTGTDSFVFQNTIYVPLRSIAALVPGSSLTWNPEFLRADLQFPWNNTVKKLSFYSNSKTYLTDDKLSELPMTTLNKKGNMMISLSSLAQLLGFKTHFDTIYQTVSLSDFSFVINPKALENRFYNSEEVKIFSRLIYRESGSVGYTAMHAVASVVVNQIRHPYYANTVSGAIFAKAPSGIPHFTPAHKANFANVIPSYESVLAAKRTLRGENSVGPCLFFNTRPFKNRTIYTKIRGIYFCY